ncbi:MAG: hypothetical protein AMJ65_05885 [Phycisphaerae bacterium SG8_4]|nr:MAG: hypothetical protein AMJ65_05885 [Phycisphaerae bacterium SG8_4]
MKRSIILTLAALLVAATLASAATRSVPGNYATIQEAISDCNDQDVVIVEPGTYFENINYLGKEIVVTSTDPGNPEIVAVTIVDGDGEGSVVTFENGESPQAVLTGFTIVGGYGTANTTIPEAEYVVWGGGIYCLNSSPTIKGNVIMNNIGPLKMENDLPVALGYGGGIACVESSPIITGNIIKNNSAYAGGGIMTYMGNAEISNNIVYDNSASVGGGLLLLAGGRLFNNTISGNDASGAIAGGGSGFAGNVYVESSVEIGQCPIVNNIICNAKSGGGLFSVSVGSNPVAFNDVWNNSGGNYGSTNLQTGEQFFDGAADKTGTDGNISQDPLFAGPQSNDYHLLMDSPCIGAGDPDFVPGPDGTDIDGDTRIYAAIVDIGADEYIGYVKPIANAGPDQYVETPRPIALDGSESFFYDHNTAAAFEWEQLAGPEVQLSDPTSVQTKFTPQTDGEYRFALVVSDGTNSSRPDEVLVTVRNRPPVADAGPDQSWSSIPVVVTLDGRGSGDPGDQAVTYHWRQIAGPAVELSDENAAEPAFAPTELGVCVFELIVNDGLLDSEPDIVGIVIGNRAPTADAGSSRYAARDPIVLDGTGSFDRDGYGELSYQWRQVWGQSVNIADVDTATPTISGFTQANTVQLCEFELTVSDGDLFSRPDTVEVIVVPDFGNKFLVQTNPPFDPEKPTIVGFGGGNCTMGGGWSLPSPADWYERTNFLTVSSYEPPYDEYGDVLIVYLSSVAPDYAQPIQTMGFSTGNMPAIDVAIGVNEKYADARFAVNRVTLLDPACRGYSDYISRFLASAVDAEPCWIDNYFSTAGTYNRGALNVKFPAPPATHSTPPSWFGRSANASIWPGGDLHNDGVTAGYYISVAGPGKNLRLAPDANEYYFEWNSTADHLEFYNESAYPARIPKPAALVGPEDGAFVDVNGALFGCDLTEGAVGYRLLLGPDPQNLNYIVSDTPDPPLELLATLPFETTYWTVVTSDQHGATIYPDPMRIESVSVQSQPIENVTTGKTYPSIQSAINDAGAGDEIVIGPGIYRHFENIDFKGKSLTVRSADPDDPDVVSATIINGRGRCAAVRFSSGEDANSVLAGITITGGDWGLYCTGASPTVTKCVIRDNTHAGIRLWKLGNPTITHCDIVANGGAGIEMVLYKSGRYVFDNYPTITNCLVAANSQHGISGGDPTITNCTIVENLLNGIDGSVATVTNSIIYFNGNGSPEAQISDSTATVTYTDIRGAWPGAGNIDADPAFVSLRDWGDADNPNSSARIDGDYHLKSAAARWSTEVRAWTSDDITSPCIDAGDPASPLGAELQSVSGDPGNERGENLRINMGAYGGTKEASLAVRD